MSSYEYNQLLKFLYFEGYADSYEEAECILEDMSDEEFEELNESRRKAAHSFPLTKQELAHVASMERMSRGDYSSSPAGAPSTETRSARKADPTSTTPTTSKPTRKSEFIDRSGASDQGNIGSRRRIREERENFDIISEFLFVEGYADTIESAELMVEGISAEWVEEIMEANVDKIYPEHNRSEVRLNRYDNPSGALALGGGQQRARREEHKERRGIKTKNK